MKKTFKMYESEKHRYGDGGNHSRRLQDLSTDHFWYIITINKEAKDGWYIA